MNHTITAKYFSACGAHPDDMYSRGVAICVLTLDGRKTITAYRQKAWVLNSSYKEGDQIELSAAAVERGTL